jgi:hypothetical protein
MVPAQGGIHFHRLVAWLALAKKSWLGREDSNLRMPESKSGLNLAKLRFSVWHVAAMSQ